MGVSLHSEIDGICLLEAIQLQFSALEARIFEDIPQGLLEEMAGLLTWPSHQSSSYLLAGQLGYFPDIPALAILILNCFYYTKKKFEFINDVWWARKVLSRQSPCLACKEPWVQSPLQHNDLWCSLPIILEVEGSGVQGHLHYTVSPKPAWPLFQNVYVHM